MLIYNNTTEDLITFNQYHLEHSESFKKHAKQGRLRFLIICLLIFGVVGFIKNDVFPIYVGLIFGVVYYLISTLTHEKSAIRGVKKLIELGNYKSFVCEHKLYIEDDFLMEETEHERSGYKIKSIHDIIHTDKHCFLYIDEHRAHVIPKDHMTEGNIDEFLELIEGMRK